MEPDDPEVRRFLRGAMVARIATLSRGGRPSITPLYFGLLSGHIWLGTASWTLAAREVNANPHVSVLFQQERSRRDRRILRLTGQAVVRTDAATMQRSRRQMAFKYILTPGGLLHQALHLRLSGVVRRYRLQSAAKGAGCVIDVTPEHVEFLDGPGGRPMFSS